MTDRNFEPALSVTEETLTPYDAPANPSGIPILSEPLGTCADRSCDGDTVLQDDKSVIVVLAQAGAGCTIMQMQLGLDLSRPSSPFVLPPSRTPRPLSMSYGVQKPSPVAAPGDARHVATN